VGRVTFFVEHTHSGKLLPTVRQRLRHRVGTRGGCLAPRQRL